MSLVEVMIGVAALGLVALGVLSYTKISSNMTQRSRQQNQINNFITDLSRVMSKKDSCDLIVSHDGTGLVVDLQNFPSNPNLLPVSQRSVTLVDIIVTPQPVGGVGPTKAPYSVLLRFRLLDGSFSARTVRGVAEFDGGAYIGCLDYEDMARQSVFKLNCESIGGRYIIGTVGNDECDLNNISPTHDFSIAIKRTICEEIYKGSYDLTTQKCDSIDIENNATIGANIKLEQVRINGNQWRSTFTQNCSGVANRFIRSVNEDGSVGCIDVVYCHPNNGCAAPPAPPVIPSPPPPPPPPAVIPIDGGWSNSYGPCVLTGGMTCGDGFQYASCNNPAPANGGADCPDPQPSVVCTIACAPVPSPPVQGPVFRWMRFQVSNCLHGVRNCNFTSTTRNSYTYNGKGDGLPDCSSNNLTGVTCLVENEMCKANYVINPNVPGYPGKIMYTFDVMECR